MVDPLTVVGTIGAIANVVDAVTKSINAIRDIHGRWTDADLAFLSLAAQLTAFRAALVKIKAWSESESAQRPDYQLTIDLETSLACCRLLVSKIDSFLEDLNHAIDQPLDLNAKVKFVFGIRQLEEVQKMIERQIGALSLLLSACNCQIASERTSLLQDRSTRTVLQRVKCDSASLIVHRDSSSVHSSWSDRLSRLSIRFDFDRDLLTSSIYEKLLRSTLKASIREDRDSIKPSDACKEARKRSAVISRQLRRDKRRDLRILMLGDGPGCEEVFREIDMHCYGQVHEAGFAAYLPVVFDRVNKIADTLMHNLRASDDIALPAADHGGQREHCEATLSPDRLGLIDNTADWLDALYHSSVFEEVLCRSHDALFRRRARYFLGNIKRLSSPGYIPSEEDVQQARLRPSGYRMIPTTRYHYIRVNDPGEYKAKVSSLVTTPDGTYSVLFVLNLSKFETESFGGQDGVKIPGLDELKVVLCAMGRKYRSIMIFLTGVYTSTNDLASVNICRYSSSPGISKLEIALSLIQDQCQLLNDAKLDMYFHVSGSSEESTVQWILAATDDAFIQRGLNATIF